MTTPTRLAGRVLTGLLAAGTALAVAELVAALVGRPDASPVFAVGRTAIDLAPRPVKDWAIRSFGTGDKPVLVGGIVVVLALYAAVVGVLAASQPPLALGLVALFGAVGVAAARSRPDSDLVDALPALAAGITGAVALHLLTRAQRPAGNRPPDPPPAGLAPDQPERRRLLLTGTLVAGAGVASGLAGWALGSGRSAVAASRASVRIPHPASPAPPLPFGTDPPVAGLTRFVTPNDAFYRVDTALRLPQLAAADWRLRVHGMVERPLALTYEQLISRPLVERHIMLTCVSNEIGGELAGTARWTGVLVSDILREAGVAEGADQVVSRSVDGMTIGTPTAALTDGRAALLAVAMNGEPLPLAHGFPVRMVVPGLYGYVSACKWITELEVTTFDAFDAYWVRRGWATSGPVKITSRIDTPRPSARLGAAREIAVAGMAWAPGRGIGRVEVRIDDQPWQRARLAPVPSVDTWRQWVYPWTPSSGEHVLRVRATDSDGRLQSERRVPPYPDGAAGWHTITVTVT